MIVKEVIDVILAECKTPSLEKTCDLLMAGDWKNEVTGIATTFMATADVIRQSASKGANLIITHEPTFFTSFDWENTAWLQNDPVYLRKMDLIRRNNINIWRFHDHMHMVQPDLIYVGLLKELGWEEFIDPADKHSFILPNKTIEDAYKAFEKKSFSLAGMTVNELAAYLKEKLQVKMAQIVGDPATKINRVAVLVGGGSLGLGRDEMPMEMMRNSNLDCIVCGEILEWTLPAYVRDAAQLGMNKSLIILGHNRTEEVGMKYLPEWLQKLFPHMPISFIEAGEPFEYL